MIHPRTTLAEVMIRSRCLLFDFDGPICSIFVGLPARTVAAHLRKLVASRGIEITAGTDDSRDPFDVLRFAATCSSALAQAVSDELRTMELPAVEMAEPASSAAPTQTPTFSSRTRT